MNNLKKALTSAIAEPAAKSSRSSTIVGTVTKSNEDASKCDVEFYNESGTLETRKNVDVISYNYNVIDWFPNKGDKVLMNYKNETLFISGPGEPSSNLKNKLEVKNDIFSDSFIDSIGGFVF